MATFTEEDLKRIKIARNEHQDILDFIRDRGETYYDLIGENLAYGKVTTDETTAFMDGDYINLLIRQHDPRAGRDKVFVYPVPRQFIFDTDGTYEQKLRTLIALQDELNLPTPQNTTEYH